MFCVLLPVRMEHLNSFGVPNVSYQSPLSRYYTKLFLVKLPDFTFPYDENNVAPAPHSTGPVRTGYKRLKYGSGGQQVPSKVTHPNTTGLRSQPTRPTILLPLVCGEFFFSNGPIFTCYTQIIPVKIARLYLSVRRKKKKHRRRILRHI